MSPEIESLLHDYQKEFDDAYKKCREKYIITQSDIDSNPIGRNYAIPILGDETSRFKQTVETPNDGLELLKNAYGPLQFIANKQTHLYLYGGWDLDNIDTEISQIEDFIKKANSYKLNYEDLKKSNFFGIDSGYIEYIKLKTGYYNNVLMTWEQLNPSSSASWAYGRLFLFYEFLQNERKQYLNLMGANVSSLYTPLQKLDLVLSWFATNQDAIPYCSNDLRTKKSLAVNANFDTTFLELYKILKKLEIDGNIQTWNEKMTTISNNRSPIEIEEPVYQITWEGQFFISTEIGGYEGEYKEKKRRDFEMLNMQSSQTNSMAMQTEIQDKVKSLTKILAVVGSIACIVPIATLVWDFWKFYHPQYRESLFLYQKVQSLVLTGIAALVATGFLALYLCSNLRSSSLRK